MLASHEGRVRLEVCSGIVHVARGLNCTMGMVMKVGAISWQSDSGQGHRVDR